MRQLGQRSKWDKKVLGLYHGSEEVNQVETEPAKHGDSGARQGSVRQDSSADRRGWPEHDIKDKTARPGL